MNTKEAIEFRTIIKILEGIRLRLEPYNYERGSISRSFSRDDYKSIDKVISLLKRGEKFEEMWGEFKKGNYVGDRGAIDFDSAYMSLKQAMNEFEQKYFPRKE